MDEDDMDFPEALRLLQAPQSPGPERLPFKNLFNASSPQRHLPLKSSTRERICFKLVAKPRRPGNYRPPWATSTTGASRDSQKTAGATHWDNGVMHRARDRRRDAQDRHLAHRSPLGLPDNWNLLRERGKEDVLPDTKTYQFSFRATVPAPDGEDLLRPKISEMAPTSPPGGALRYMSIPLRWAWA